jgi:N-acetylneuraminate lyase
MTTHRLTGLVAATHTPFTADDALDLSVIEKQAGHLLDNQVTCAFIGGTTGECQSLSLEERRQLAQRWMEIARGTPLKVVVHVGSNCLADARTLAAQAQELGALAIAAMSPSYFKPRNLDALVACCADVAAAAPEIPFYFYDIPALTGVSFPMPDFLSQAHGRIPTLAGIKFTNLDLMAFQLCLQAQREAFDVPYGIDELLLAALALGARGAVGSTYNFAAPLYHRLIKAFQGDDLSTARLEQLRSVQLIRMLGTYGYLPAAKAVMKMMGVDVGPARLPHPTLTSDQVIQLRGDLERLGFFDWIR